MRVVTALALSIAASPAWAWGNDCRHEAPRSLQADLAGVAAVEIWALAGQLEVRGAGRADLRAEGRACASSPEALSGIALQTSRLDDVLQVKVRMPEEARSGGAYGVLDLEVELPVGLPVAVHDSSGDLEISNVASIELTDSSGDAEIRDVHGTVTVLRDSSGSLRIRHTGHVVIETDSSGDVLVEDAASVVVRTDTSGDLEFRDIAGDVAVGTDSSGDILAYVVGGRVTVEADTSGEIRTRDVAGEVRLPPNKR